jgi:WD40 repeat protein
MPTLLVMKRITLFFVAAFATQTCGADVAPDYSKQIAPIFRKYCTSCHNADDRDGDLSLESFADLQKGGEHGVAVLPGNAESSRLLRLVTGTAEPKMPPDDEKPPSAAEIELLKAWIEGGAKGPDGVEPDRTVLLTPSIPPADVPRSITALALSPDGKQLAVARFGRVELVDAVSNNAVHTLKDLPGKVNSLSFSKDGKWLLTASGIVGLYGKATIWDVADGKPAKHFQGHRDTLYDAELSSDGKLLATCSYDRKAIIWDVTTGKELRSLTGHNDAIYDLEFSPDGSVLATASGDETCKLWEVATGERLDTLGQPQAEQYVVRFSPNGRYVVAGGADNRIRVWRFVSKTRPRINPLVYSRFAHEGPIVQLGFSPDGRSLISIAEDKTLKQWETKTYTEAHAFADLPNIAAALAIGSQQTFFVGGMDGTFASYSLAKPTPTDSTAQQVAVVASETADEPMKSVTEKEPNDTPKLANSITTPAVVSGVILANGDASQDADLYRFESKAGQ